MLTDGVVVDEDKACS